jgi:hypothetical protein
MTDTQAKQVFLASYMQPHEDSIDVDAAIRAGRRRTRRRSIALGAATSVAVAASVVIVSTTGWPQSPRESSTTAQAGFVPQDSRLRPSPSDRIFDGLPPDVVVEVLNNPAAQANIAMPLPTEDRDSMWQGMVGNFVMCRQLLDVYTTWRRTGAPPAQELAIVRPDHPLQPSYGDLQMLYKYYGEHIRNGQVTTLATDLTNDSGCGKWIPAAPGDSSGPTIAEVVRGTK